MIVVLSPAKRLDFKSNAKIAANTQPDMLLKSQLLVEELKSYTTTKLASLMHLSDKLATLNAQRYRNFHVPFTPDNAKQAIFAFRGDVYSNIEIDKYSEEDYAFAQDHIRILSGLYGLLRPLDLIQPYRLEMGTKLKTRYGKDLYEFWGEYIMQTLDQLLATHDQKVLINLASNEYFKAVKPKKLSCPVINMVFKEDKNGRLAVVGVHAKKARGNMANYIIKNRIDDPAKLKKFRTGGYKYNASLSDKKNFVFVR
ncbi:MAG: peroxide stress protein YaaA [Rickettsiales bacterium]